MMNPWTTQDVAFLGANYPVRGKHFCAKSLNRTVTSIRWKASALGLKQDRKSAFTAHWQSRAASSKGGESWSAQHEAFLRHNYPQIGKRGCAKELGRTVRSVQVKASRMGIEQSEQCTFNQRSQAMRTMALSQSQERSDRMSWLQAAGALRNQYSRGKQGRRADLDGMYFRSSWEANYARYLNWLKAEGQIHDWQYEPDTFWFKAVQRGTRSYTPDFKISESVSAEPYYIEIKGWMDDRSATKLRRMSVYYPLVRIVVVDEKQYKELAKWSRLFPCWESVRAKPKQAELLATADEDPF